MAFPARAGESVVIPLGVDREGVEGVAFEWNASRVARAA